VDLNLKVVDAAVEYYEKNLVQTGLLEV
jgi:hypothetical protein